MTRKEIASLALGVVIGITSIMILVNFTNIGDIVYTNKMYVAEHQEKIEKLRARIYNIEGMMNRDKWDARRKMMEEAFEGAVKI